MKTNSNGISKMFSVKYLNDCTHGSNMTSSIMAHPL